MTWIRLRFTLLLTLLTVWIAAMFASGVVAIAAFTAGSILTVTDTSAPALIAVPTVACP